MNKKDRKKSARGTIICIVIGIRMIVHDFAKMDKAARYSDKILRLYFNANNK